MKYRELTRKLKCLGCEEVIERRSGSHRIWVNTSNGMESSIPDWRGRDLKIGTIRSIIRKLGINYNEFRNI